MQKTVWPQTRLTIALTLVAASRVNCKGKCGIDSYAHNGMCHDAFPRFRIQVNIIISMIHLTVATVDHSFYTYTALSLQ